MSPTPVRVPGDKSIAHRALILAALADGQCELANLPASDDLASTRRVLVALGARFEASGESRVSLSGPTGWRHPSGPLDCGNSGTTARLLAGLLTGLGVPATLAGDTSLSGRPMDRVVYPLQAMGGRLRYQGDRDRLPVVVEPRASGSLRVLRYRSRVASAQVKSSLLLAGLASGTEVEIHEPAVTRDHTERLLAALGAPVEFGPLADGGARARLAGGREPTRERRGAIPGFELEVPGDLSSAAFLGVAALLTGRRLQLEDMGLNPTRTGWIELLMSAGARLETRVRSEQLGEPVGAISLEPGPMRSFRLGPEEAVRCIDEIPVLAVLAARIPGVTEIHGATELRVKESDRLALISENLRGLGVRCEEFEDGLQIEGTERPLTGRVRTGGDHRIAMAFGTLGAAADCEIEVDEKAAVGVSYPGFWRDLERLGRGDGR